jgi:hypothetical protein
MCAFFLYFLRTLLIHLHNDCMESLFRQVMFPLYTFDGYKDGGEIKNSKGRAQDGMYLG